jgi:transcription elongation factor Elf1
VFQPRPIRIESDNSGSRSIPLQVIRTETAGDLPADERDVDGGVICPLCGRSVPAPIVVRSGARALAECEECDLYFEVRPAAMLERR